MAIDFSSILTSEQKRSIIEQRIAQFAAEGYQHTLNKAAAISVNPDADTSTFDEAISVISGAIEAHQAELASLED